jgi:CRISPR/Cas system CSM-associated protein Csm3 (group 7 of RAMP superfamily)
VVEVLPKAKFVGLLSFKSEGPIHVGKAREGNVLYALRLPDGRLLIPASTWKGVFRALAERLALTMPMDGLEKLAVEMVMPAQRQEEAAERVGRERDLVDEFRAALEKRSSRVFDPADVEEKLLSLGYSTDPSLIESLELALVHYLCLYCPVGKLFGNWARAGAIRFFDAALASGTQRRPGIGISRGMGTVQENALFCVETSEAGLGIPLALAGEVEGRGSTPAKLLASMLEAVGRVGLSVGGRKSVGLGLLSLQEARFHAFEIGEGQDESGALLANPLKTPPMSLVEFLAWLRAQA